MSGHSKWATIRRKKDAKDARRGKAFTQLIREISIAARLGGGDADANPRLRLARARARAVNMPKDNIERAIKKGTGELEGESYEEIRYEGYGPGGVALIVDAVTDNRNRTVGEVRHIFGKHAGNLGASGCVAYLFDRAGVLEFDRERLDAEALIEAAIEANAQDVSEDDDAVRVQTAPEDFAAIKEALEATGFTPASAEIQMLPQTTVEVSGRDAQTVLKLFEALDDHEDVRGVYANFEISEEELQKAAEPS
ncbi:MAG: YebC/PmpR family DNA-binding transcriptional regulator [Myxococcota bacterium]